MQNKTLRAFSMMLLLASMTSVAQARMTTCKMSFEMRGWAAFYKVSHGTGTIRCDNGQRARVKLEAKGGGIAAGRSEVHNGIGKFSEVRNIEELFGSYAAGNATAGAGKSASATVVTKGEISLALTGKGSGVEVGVSFGKFTISRK